MTKQASIWQQEASRVLRKLMSDHSVNPDELARRLAKLGIRVSGQAVRNKLPRGTFSAAFLLAAIASMRTARVTLRGRELAALRENEVAKGAAAKLAEAGAAAQETADAEKSRWQLEALEKMGFRPDLPVALNRAVAKVKKAKGKK
jgi:hypothetical protein